MHAHSGPHISFNTPPPPRRVPVVSAPARVRSCKMRPLTIENLNSLLEKECGAFVVKQRTHAQLTHGDAHPRTKARETTTTTTPTSQGDLWVAYELWCCSGESP